MTKPPPDTRRLLQQGYEAFNARDIDSALTAMHSDVDWANGMEGGSVYGHDGVRAYWTRQWTMIDPHVEPVRFTTDPDGDIVVDVHQVVHDLDGNVLADRMVQHVYTVVDGKVRRMRIR